MPSKKLGLFVLAATALGLAACEVTSTSSAVSSAQESTSATSSSQTSPSSSSSSSTTSTSNPSSSSSSSISTSTSEEPTNVDIAYADDTFAFGGAGEAGTGRFVYWAGDGGSVASASKSAGVYHLNYSSTGQWYGIQAFYKLPYAASGDSYTIKMTLTSNVAGKITINGGAVNVIAGETVYEASFAQGTGNTIEMQLGIDGTPLAGSTFSFSTPIIYDTTAGAKYHEVKFVNGATTVMDIEVKDGKTVTAPSDPTPADGYFFDGWYNGEAAFSAKDAVTAEATYTAKFLKESEATRYTVTFMGGSTVLGTAQIVKGKTVVVPSLAYPFGYTVETWYSDEGLTTVWNLDTGAVNGDLVLYGKLLVTPTSTYMAASDTGYKIPDINIAHNDDGSLKVSGFAGWAANKWDVQVNFTVPTGTSGKTYTLSFEYKINGNGADAQIYDNATIGNVVTLTTTTSWTKASIVFAGGVLSSNNKLTFELGAIAGSVTVDFELANLTLVAA